MSKKVLERLMNNEKVRDPKKIKRIAMDNAEDPFLLWMP